ncbi:MAG TPA: hypothetical protein VIC26_05270 [Marinagarivorans sp.]
MTKSANEQINSRLIGRSIPFSGEIDNEPDDATKEEEQSLERERKQLENNALIQELEFKKEEHSQRIKYAKRIYTLIVAWLVFIGFVVICSGLKVLLYEYFELSDKVIITLLTTTTVTVIGLFGTVLKYLFGRQPNRGSATDKP